MHQVLKMKVVFSYGYFCINDELLLCCVESPAGDDNNEGTAAEGTQPDTKGESTSVVKKLLLESMLKSVQAVLKQQQPG